MRLILACRASGLWTALLGAWLVASVWAGSASEPGSCAGRLDISFDAGAGVKPLWSEPFPIRQLMVQPDGKVVVAGELTEVQGVLRRSVARLNSDGSLDASFAPKIDGPVDAAALLPDGKLLITGSFRHINGLPAPGIGRLNPDGTPDATFAVERQDISSRALGLTASGGVFAGFRLHAAGDGVERYSVTLLNADGKQSSGWRTPWWSEEPIVSLIVEGDSQVLANGVYRLRNAQDEETLFHSLPEHFEVLCATRQSDGKILLGGRRQWEAENLDVIPGLVRLNRDGTVDQTFAGPVQLGLTDPGWGARQWLSVNALKLDGQGRIYMAGFFTRVQGAPRSLVARLHPDGTLDESFVPDISVCVTCDWDAVHKISVMDLDPSGKLCVAGLISAVNGLPRNSVVRLHTAPDGCAGAVRFAAPLLRVKETATNALIRVVREGNLETRVTVGYTRDPGDLGGRYGEYSPADPSADYDGEDGVVVFEPGEAEKTMALAIYDDKVAENAETFGLLLRDPAGGVVLTSQPAMCVLVIDDETATTPGSVDESFHADLAESRRMTQLRTLLRLSDGSFLLSAQFEFGPSTYTNVIMRLDSAGQRDPSWQLDLDGAAVEAVFEHGPGLLISGEFAQVNRVPRPGLARITTDGSLDLSFDPQVDQSVECMAVAADGRIIIAGSFSLVGQAERQRLARLEATGELDPTFDPGLLCADSTIRTVAALADGRVLIAGDLHTTYGLPSIRIACLAADGSLDGTFFTGAFQEGWVNRFVQQPDGNILVAGYLREFNGYWGSIGRIYPDGTPDPSFIVRDIAGTHNLTLQPDGKVLVNGRLRLLPDGTSDRTFFTGAGPGSGESASLVLPDGSILVAGAFQGFNGMECSSLARVRGGATLGAGWFALTGDTPWVQEDAGAALFRVHRYGGTQGAVTVPYRTVADSAVQGKDFLGESGEVHFAAGDDSEQVIRIPVLHDPDLREPRSFRVLLGAPTAGALAPTHDAYVTITDAEVGVRFSETSFWTTETPGVYSGWASVVRVGQPDTPFSVDVSVSDGTGRAGEDYVATNITVRVDSRVTLTSVEFPVLHNAATQENKTVVLRLSNPSEGVVLMEPSTAVLNIVDTDRVQLVVVSPDPVSCQARLRVHVPPAQFFQLQASSDLMGWTVIESFFGPLQAELPLFIDPVSDLYPCRFYRLASPTN